MLFAIFILYSAAFRPVVIISAGQRLIVRDSAVGQCWELIAGRHWFPAECSAAALGFPGFWPEWTEDDRLTHVSGRICVLDPSIQLNKVKICVQGWGRATATAVQLLLATAVQFLSSILYFSFTGDQHEAARGNWIYW